ncbi:MAG TPA: TolC family protein [Chthoniobacterales bacterium]|jgi:outer membrane protein TolC|nr:TolC family protein [Chthoniobacterales bacterium]
MKTTYLLLFSLTLILSLQIAEAGDTGARTTGGNSLSLGEVTAAALANNAAIKEALRKWNAAKARVPQAAGWDDPRLGGDSRVRRFVDVPPNAFMDQSVSVEQLVPITGKNLVRARAAAAEAVSAYEDVRRQQLDVIASARAAFFLLANAYEQLEINEKNIVSLKQIADISRSKYEAGTETAANVLVAETEASKVLEAQRDLERQLSDEQAQLNALMNRDAFTPLSEPETASIKAPELSPAALRPLVLAQRPEIKMAEAKIDMEKSKLQLARREWIPDPALTVKAQRYNDAAQAVSELDAGVSFSVPWVNFRKYTAGVREAGENLGAAEHGLDRSQKEALRLLRDQLQKIETAHHHVELFRDKIVPQAQQAFEANRLSYESGKASFLDWITSQRNLRDLEAMARQHLTDYQVAIAELEAIVGAQVYPLPDDSKLKNKSR